MLKIDKKGNILRPNGTILGAPKKTGNIYRSSNRTGRIDLTTGNVFDLKEQLLGSIDIEKFEILKEATLKEATGKINKKKEIADVKASKKSKSKKSKNKPIKAAPEDTPEEVSDSTPKSEPKKESEDTYIPGLDSALIVSGKLSKMIYKPRTPSAEEKALQEINKNHGWRYTDWDELSYKEDITDSELEKYESYVNWYSFLLTHPDREFNNIYKKKFKQHLILRNLNLVPYNETRVTALEESPIQEDRKSPEPPKEHKAKREMRKKIRNEE